MTTAGTAQKREREIDALSDRIARLAAHLEAAADASGASVLSGPPSRPDVESHGSSPA